MDKLDISGYGVQKRSCLVGSSFFYMSKNNSVCYLVASSQAFLMRSCSPLAMEVKSMLL
jgi:hypothetical protein